MKGEVVIVELDANRAVRRVGTVTGTSGAQSKVIWPDGTSASVRVGPLAPGGGSYVKAVAGSWHFDLLVRRAEIEALLASDPAGAFVLLLQGQDHPRTARQLRESLEMAQFAPDSVQEAWNRARKALESNPDVKSTGSGAQRAFKWVGTRPSSETATTPAATGKDRVETSIATGQELSGESSVAEAQDKPGSAQPEPSAPQQPAPPVAQPAGPGADFEAGLLGLASGHVHGTGASVVLEEAGRRHVALRAIAEALTGGAPGRSAAKAAEDVLASGVVLADVKDEVVAAAWDRLADAKRAFVLGIARRSKVVDAADPLDVLGVDGAAALLERASAEVARARRGDPKDVRRAFGWLLDRMLRSARVSELGVAALSVAASSGAARDDDQLERLVAAAAHAVERGGPAGWDRLDGATRDRLARASALLPLTAKGSRARLLTSIRRVAPTTLDSAQWWQNVGVDGLIDAAGPLGAVLDREQVASGITRPMYEAALAGATTRRRVMELLAAPVTVARTAEPSIVAAALSRCAPNDEVLRSWMADLRDEAGRTTLLAAAEAARGERDGAVETARVANERAERAEAQAAKLTERLHAAADASGTLRESQTRQAQIDAVRGLATLAAYVEKSVGHQDPDRVVARVRGLVARQGLTPLGEIGGQVPYEPDKHDLVGPGQDAGAPVVVRSSGYTWHGPEGDLVLVRAVVEPAN